MDNGKFTPKKIVFCIIAAMIIIIGIFCSLTSVPPGSTGVVVCMGSVTDKVLDDGWHFKIPFFEKVIDVSNKVLKTDVNADSISKDLQPISSNISLNYHLAPESSADMYKNVGMEYNDTLLQPVIQESIKAIMAKYSAEELITNRAKVGIEISNEIRNKMTDYGIIIDEFNLVNFNFSEAFNNAIEAKQIAEQDKLKAETEKERRIIEADAAAKEQVIDAEAEAKAVLAKAQAEAESVKIKAEANAEANKKINESLTDKVLKYNQIEAWDGSFPSVVSGDSTSMLIDVTN